MVPLCCGLTLNFELLLLYHVSIIILFRFRNDVEIREDDGYEITENDGILQLILRDAEPEDSGEFTVEVKNSAGIISESFTVDIQGSKFYFLLVSIFSA